MLEYYLSKGFFVLEWNANNLKIIANYAKQIFHAMDMHDSDHVMNCTTTIPSIPNMLNKLLLQYDLHSSYNQTRYIGEEEIIHNIFSPYDEPLLNYINNPELVQEWKLNLDGPGYENN